MLESTRSTNLRSLGIRRLLENPILFALALGIALGGAGCSSGSSNTDGCQADGDCPAGRYCRVITGDCTFDCTFDQDCLAGFRCTERGRCERGCVQTNHGVEACDGLDNDCDDQTDEDFPDLGQPCGNEHCPGDHRCTSDGSGVECTARLPAADDATCDGLDDDCDGTLDEDATERPCPLQLGVCAGTTQICLATGDWAPCDYGPSYAAADTTCDELDNDCDGSTDDEADPLLVPEAGAEATDSVDNNCNGLVDEPGGVMVPIPGMVDVWIDAFETAVFTSPDCTGPQLGVGADDYPPGWPAEGLESVTLYACSLPGVVPSGYLSYYRSRRACEAQGKQLCADSAWRVGCSDSFPDGFPYGPTFIEAACNDPFGGTGQAEPTGSFSGCTSGAGTFDSCGNLAEWLRDFDTDPATNARLEGGSYLCWQCRNGNNCEACDRNDPVLWDAADDILDCEADDNSWVSYPPGTAREDFGGRCCLLGP